MAANHSPSGVRNAQRLEPANDNLEFTPPTAANDNRSTGSEEYRRYRGRQIDRRRQLAEAIQNQKKNEQEDRENEAVGYTPSQTQPVRRPRRARQTKRGKKKNRAVKAAKTTRALLAAGTAVGATLWLYVGQFLFGILGIIGLGAGFLSDSQLFNWVDIFNLGDTVAKIFLYGGILLPLALGMFAFVIAVPIMVGGGVKMWKGYNLLFIALYIPFLAIPFLNMWPWTWQWCFQVAVTKYFE